MKKSDILKILEKKFEYLPKSGALDECNGLKIDNSYTYFATTSYPFFPRCFKGEVNSFSKTFWIFSPLESLLSKSELKISK